MVSEGVNGKDLNSDGDSTDDVVLLDNRQTGVAQRIGANGSAGRATVRIFQPPFSFPATATEADIAAYLEPETAQGYQDVTGDGDVVDTILRVFRLGAAQVTAGGYRRRCGPAPQRASISSSPTA